MSFTALFLSIALLGEILAEIFTIYICLQVECISSDKGKENQIFKNLSADVIAYFRPHSKLILLNNTLNSSILHYYFFEEGSNE